MIWIDYVILGVICFSAMVSLVRGFVKEALSLVIWFTAFFIASNFYTELAVYFTNFNDKMLRNGSAIAVLFVATLIVGAVVNYVIGQLVQKNGFVWYRSCFRSCFWCGSWRAYCCCGIVLY